MGRIKKILFQSRLPERDLHNSRMFVDLSENIHIHYRELRLMFSVEEFNEFFSILNQGGREIKKYLKKNPDYEEQKTFDVIMIAGGAKRQTTPLRYSPQPHVSKYFPSRLQIELQEEDVIDAVHIHFRDYRLAMNLENFREFSGGMHQARINLETYINQHGYKEGQNPFHNIVSQEAWAQSRISFWDRVKRFGKRLLDNFRS